MAFKTDTLQLKEYTNDPATAAAGELAIVGTAGNRVLKLYDDGSWADVSASAGGGAAELNELSDVLSSPSTVNHIAFVEDDNGVSKMNFGFLNVSMIEPTALDTATEASDTDDTLMSSLAIKNKIESYNYSRLSNHNYVRNVGWGQDQYVSAGSATADSYLDNITWANTVDPGVNNELIVYEPSRYAAAAKITIMNASVYQMTIQRNGTSQFNCTQISGLTPSFVLESFQKAILIKIEGSSDWEVIIASI